MSEQHAYPLDLDMARRAIAAQAFIEEHCLQDALGAELRATMPQCVDEYICWGADAEWAYHLASRLPKEFGTLEQLEPLAREYVSGSRRKFLLEAMERVVADYQSAKPPEPEPVEDEPEPPPPADWVPSYLDPEDCGQPDHAAPAAPIEIKSAEDVPDCVRRAAQRRAGH